MGSCGGSNPASRCGRRTSLLGGRQKGLPEDDVEIIAGPEIFATILFGFAEHALAEVDEVEDDVAEVGAGADAPFAQGKEAHGAEGAQGVETDAFQELLSGDVAIYKVASWACRFVDGVLSAIEGFANEVVGFGCEAVIDPDDFLYEFVKVDRVHQTGR